VQPTRSHDRVVDLLYCEHGPALLLFAMGITGERSRAQDAVQQVFLKLLERGDLGHAVDIKAYLFACVRNAALNDSKIRRRHVALRGARRELEVIILLSPGLTEGTSSWGKLADIPAGPHPLNGHPLKFPIHVRQVRSPVRLAPSADNEGKCGGVRGIAGGPDHCNGVRTRRSSRSRWR